MAGSKQDSGAPAALMRELGARVLGQVKQALAERTRAPLENVTEPPVVAQLMIEIRSDGSRTIARGALNDLRSAESAQIHAEGRTPAELMASLASSLLALPTTFLRGPKQPPPAAAIELPPPKSDKASR